MVDDSRRTSGSDHVPRGVRALSYVVVGLGLAYALTFCVCAALRLGYPWELEWMEGGMLAHAARVLRGQPIYAPPSLDFVAFFYTPLYSYLIAGLSSLAGGLSFPLGRAVSLLSTLATFGMLFYVGRREAGLRTGLLAVGLYAALYRCSGTFYDLARVDALALALSFAGALLAYYGSSPRTAALAALVFVAAFFTKQTSAIVAPFVGLHLLLVDRRRAAWFAAVGIVTGLAVGYAVDRASGGWFRFYTIQGHQGHRFYADNFFLEYWRDLLFLCPFLVLVPALGASYGRYTRFFSLAFMVLLTVAFVQRARTLDYESHMYYRELWYETPRYLILVPPLVITALLLWARRDANEAKPPPLFFLLLYFAGALASDLNHSTQWAYSNCFMPIALYGSLYVALIVASLEHAQDDGSGRQNRAAIALSLALIAQLAALYYDPRDQVPTTRDRNAVMHVQNVVDEQPGPVFFPAHPLYSFRRDGTVHLHQMGIGDVDFAGGLRDFEPRLEKGEFPTVVEEDCCKFPQLEKYYEKLHTFHFKRGALRSKTGFATRPTAVWVHRSRVPGTR